MTWINGTAQGKVAAVHAQMHWKHTAEAHSDISACARAEMSRLAGAQAETSLLTQAQV